MSRVVISAGRGCVLRQLLPSDADKYFTLLKRNSRHLSRFGEPIPQNFPTKTATARRIHAFLKESIICMGIWRGKVLVGSIQLRYDTGPVAEMSYLLGREHQGHGLVRRATRALIRYEKRRKLVLMYAYVSTGNERSIRVLERLGFERRGVWNHNTTMWIKNLDNPG